jgi:predicted Zn-dependent peptidase
MTTNISLRLYVAGVVAALLCAPPPNAVAQQPDRSSPPAIGPTPSFTVPALQRFTLSNGLPVVLLEKHQVPLVQVNLLVQAGSAMDPAGTNGLASMTASLMMEGAGTRDALALADAIDVLGAEINTAAGAHTMAVRLHTPVARLDSALALFVDIALRPTFPDAELIRKKKERLNSYLQWRDEARMLASAAMNNALYGDEHPYGFPHTGLEADLRNITREKCAAFHAEWFRPNRGTIIVVGDVAPGTIRQKLEAAFGKWTPGPAAPRALPPIRQVEKRGIILVDKPGAPQTELRVGRVGAPRLTNDYFPLVVVNTILGGSFSSRLNNNLREVHGYTYGASSRFDLRVLPGPFVAGSAVQTAVTDSALEQVMLEFRRIREPIDPVEVARAKNYVALSYPGEFQSVAQIAMQVEEIVTFDLPLTTFNEYVGKILAVTPEECLRVAQKYIDPEKVAIVLVGDRKAITAGIERLSLGPIVHKTVDDVLGKAPSTEVK